MSHYHLISIEAKQFFSSILVVFKIKLRKLRYTGGSVGQEFRKRGYLPNFKIFNVINGYETPKSRWLQILVKIWRRRSRVQKKRLPS